MAVGVVLENGLPAVPPLRNMMRNVHDDNPCEATHEWNVSRS